MDEAILRGGKTIQIPEDYPCTLEEKIGRDGKLHKVYCCVFGGHNLTWRGGMWME